MERLQGSASVKTVYGEPVVAEGKTIIPVAKVAYCFGVGSGPARKNEGQTEGEKAGGMGGGVRAKPIGVVEITKEGTKFIPIDERGKLAGVLLLGFILGILIVSGRSNK